MTSTGNRLLAALTRHALTSLHPALSLYSLRLGDVLFDAGDVIDHVYFPETGLVSLLAIIPGESATEVAMVASDGLVGATAALGGNRSALRALVQSPGSAHRMKRTDFRHALLAHPALDQQVRAYLQELIADIARTSACNTVHLVDARLARWLLMASDKLGRAEFDMTQAFLAAMLGVRRVGVSEAASDFQRRLLIKYSRGRILILDRPGLEHAACSCYAAGVAAHRAE